MAIDKNSCSSLRTCVLSSVIRWRAELISNACPSHISPRCCWNCWEPEFRVLFFRPCSKICHARYYTNFYRVPFENATLFHNVRPYQSTSRNRLVCETDCELGFDRIVGSADVVQATHFARPKSRAVDISTDFHNSFESHPSRKPFLSANLYPTVSNSDAHSNDNIVILDLQYCLCYSGCSLHRGGERSASLCPLSLYPPDPPLLDVRTFRPLDVQTILDSPRFSLSHLESTLMEVFILKHFIRL